MIPRPDKAATFCGRAWLRLARLCFFFHESVLLGAGMRDTQSDFYFCQTMLRRAVAPGSRLAALVLALIGIGLGIPATADEAQPRRIQIEYIQPKNPEHQKVLDVLKKHHALEKLQEIFSPFRLPIDVSLITVGCDGVSNAWYRRPTMTICYEYVADIRKTTPTETTSTGITPDDAALGQFVYVVAHEMGHAMFDLLDVPIFGRTEDAADQFAAYMMLQLGKGEAKRLIAGAAYSYKDYIQNPNVTVPVTAFSSVHGAPIQRFYNLLCIGYGSDPLAYADLVDSGYLPAKRAENCRFEYGEVNFAFKKLIVPNLEQALAKKVLEQTWLPPIKK